MVKLQDFIAILFEFEQFLNCLVQHRKGNYLVFSVRLMEKTPLAVVLLVFIDIFPSSWIVTDLAAS